MNVCTVPREYICMYNTEYTTSRQPATGVSTAYAPSIYNSPQNLEKDNIRPRAHA